MLHVVKGRQKSALPLLEPAFDAGAAEFQLAAELDAKGQLRAVIQPGHADTQELRGALGVKQIVGRAPRAVAHHCRQPGGQRQQPELPDSRERQVRQLPGLFRAGSRGFNWPSRTSAPPAARLWLSICDTLCRFSPA
jgi:hypothetical protein